VLIEGVLEGVDTRTAKDVSWEFAKWGSQPRSEKFLALLAAILDERTEPQVVRSNAACGTLNDSQRMHLIPGGQVDGHFLVRQLICEDEVSSHSPLFECGPAELFESLLVG